MTTWRCVPCGTCASGWHHGRRDHAIGEAHSDHSRAGWRIIGRGRRATGREYGLAIELAAGALREVAADIGSDVPFLLERRPAICRGRGEQVESLRGLPPLAFVIVHPPAGLSTAEVYRQCHPGARAGGAAALVTAWRRGCLAELGRLLQNRLQEAAATISPWIGRLHDAFNNLDFLGHQMTGSGSAYFGLCRDRKHARRLATALRSRGFSQVFAVDGLT